MVQSTGTRAPTAGRGAARASQGELRGPSGRVFILSLAMAAPSSTPAWGLPRTEEAGGLPSTGLQKVGQDCATHFHFTSYSHK